MHRRLKRSLVGFGAGEPFQHRLSPWVVYAVPLPERIDVGGSAVVYWEDEQPAHVFFVSG